MDTAEPDIHSWASYKRKTPQVQIKQVDDGAVEILARTRLEHRDPGTFVITFNRSGKSKVHLLFTTEPQGGKVIAVKKLKNKIN